MSGFSLLHSDTGGYVVLKLSVDGRQVPVIARTPELLMRWMELNAFTAVFRTHEGLDPAVSAQFDTNAATLAHLARFARVYKGLAAYRKGLVAEAAARGASGGAASVPALSGGSPTSGGCATSSCSGRT